MIPSTGSSAIFNTNKHEIGWLNTPKGRRLIVLNWSDHKKTYTIRLKQPRQIINYWTGKNLGTFKNKFVIKNMPGRDGNVYIVK